ncbi:CPBP family intramembrane metalloprotease [Paenibacillus sp. PR3]|uniref:CPBP family intramembrane metalloprotease n=1 Tax=Paenibacillus terricola TaxID=2763503 RepID=A0ABR8MRC0_9BACL|nr:CPBP family glutamic-type intramembrane protease [Paenibacillus terricola]MBD3917806.1 CPBP family intramembrane metalloprotease [Paenibacillus terricola]
MRFNVKVLAGSVLHAVLYLFVFWVISELHGKLVIDKFEGYRNFMNDNIPVFLCTVFGAVFLLFLLVSYAQQKLSKGRIAGILETARFHKLQAADIRLLVYIGVAGTLLFLSVMNLPFVKDNTQDFQSYVDTFSRADSFIYVLIGVGFLAVCFEELLFRGILYNALGRTLPLWATVLITSLVYGYFQPSFWVSVTSVFLSVLYCLVYAKLRSLWSSIIIGSVVNCLIMLTKVWGVHDAMAKLPGFVLLLSAVLSLLFIVFALFILWKGWQPVRPYAVLTGRIGLIVALYYILLQILVVIWDNAVLPRYPGLAEHGIIGLYTNALLSFPMFYFVYKLLYKQNMWKLARFEAVGWKPQLLNVALAICMAIWVMSLFSIPQVKDAAPGFESIVGFFLYQNAWVFFSFFVINSVYKEVLFRALLFNELRSKLPVTAAMIITGILYGILFFSGDLPLTLYGTAGAVIFGMLYIWHRSIWITIVNEYVLFSTYYLIRNQIGLPEGAGLYVLLVASSVGILILLYALYRVRPQAEKTVVRSTHDVQLDA